MNKILILLGIAVIVGAGWYVWSIGVFTQTPENGEEETAQETAKTVIVLAEQNDSGESGTATLTEVNGQVRVVLNLTDAPQDVIQPAHIHANTCANIGGVEYPLTFPINGQSETMLDISMEDLQAGLPLSVNVHKSPEEASVYVACGDIAL